MRASNGKGKRKASEILHEEEDPVMDEETWKPCHLSDLYEISDLGRVRRTENKFIRRNAINPHGYNYLTIPLDGKSYTRLVGRLVLHAFVRAPLDGEVAHHMDGNSDNDILENLKWVSIGEAGTTRIYPSTIESRSVIARSIDEDEVHVFISPLEASFFVGSTRSAIYDAIRFGRKFQGYMFSYDVSSDPMCEKKKIRGWEAYTISSDGRVKGKQGGWKFGAIHCSNSISSGKAYRRAQLTKKVDGKDVVKKFYMHVLVANAFLGDCPEGYQVDHIDGDPSNNDVTNLQYVSRSENNKRSYENGKKPPGEKPVVLIKPDGTFSRYKSQSEGARETGAKVPAVSQSCSKERKNKDGEYWAHDNPVIMYNEADESTERFESLTIASKETGENILHILMSCRDNNDNFWNYEG